MILAGGLLLLSACLAQPADVGRQPSIPEELASIPQGWVRKRLPRVQQDLSYLAYAYEMPQEAHSALSHLVYVRMAEQHSFEIKMATIDLSEKSDAERLAWLDDLARNSPLTPGRLEALAESLVPARDFSTPRRVFSELLARRDLRRRAEMADDMGRQQLAVWMSRQRMASAPVTPAGHPVPMWVHARSRQEFAAWVIQEKKKGQAAQRQAALRKASRDPGGSAIRRIQHERASLTSAQADRPIVVSAFDATLRAWRGYLEEIEEDRGLVGAQRASVEKTFSRMWKRALAFRATQRAAYLDLEELSSRKAFAQALARLDAPLRPLFKELKLRLDSQARAAR